MIDLAVLQKQIYANKVEKGFNVTDVYKELCYIQGELTEVTQAYARKQGNVGEEIADVAIYLLGLAEILGVDLEQELLSKVAVNQARRYETVDGVLTRIE